MTTSSVLMGTVTVLVKRCFCWMYSSTLRGP